MYTHKAITMPRVPQSNAFRSMDFLNRLGAARRPDRMEMLNGLTTIQLRGIGDVANCIRRRYTHSDKG